MHMAHILAIDDDVEMLALIRAALQKDGHAVDTAADTAQVSIERCALVQLILLDVMMPGEDGFAFCARIRGQVDCPVLFLTAKTGEAALVRGLGLGADDYIQKPFGVAELRARVAAHLRREGRGHTRAVTRGGVRFDLLARQAYTGDVPLPFTKGEYAICEYLMEHAGQTFSKEQIYEAVFGFDAEGDDSAVTEHIKNIRAKLKPHGLAPIDTVWGIGYKWKKEEV